MQVIENIPSHCQTDENDTTIDGYHWCLPGEHAWVGQSSNLYKNLSRM